jgi:hypothetical protein
VSKNKNRPKRQEKKRKQEYKKAERGRKFNPWIYRYFDVGAEYRKDSEDSMTAEDVLKRMEDRECQQ